MNQVLPLLLPLLPPLQQPLPPQVLLLSTLMCWCAGQHSNPDALNFKLRTCQLELLNFIGARAASVYQQLPWDWNVHAAVFPILSLPQQF
jgi:hypothetical protein